jgi:hypothetical protein
LKIDYQGNANVRNGQELDSNGDCQRDPGGVRHEKRRTGQKAVVFIKEEDVRKNWC